MKNMVLNLKKKKVMQNTKCLIVTCGFFGDIMYASSIAEKLRLQYEIIDYLIGFPQMHQLIQNNPYIDNVFVSDIPGPFPISSINESKYTKVIKLQPLNYLVTPCEEFQRQAGVDVNDISSEYTIYTSSEYDTIAEKIINDLKTEHNKPVIGIMSNWQSKTYLFTKEQYKLGIDVPNLGYGGAHRNIDMIVNELYNSFTLIPIGVGELNQQQTVNIPDNDTKSLLFEASLLKYCDAFIGTEGGLCNLAAGVGTKTIITGDFVHQLYGWNGVIKQIKEPKLGPIHYFSNNAHVELDPYFTDEEVIKQIIKNLL